MSQFQTIPEEVLEKIVSHRPNLSAMVNNLRNATSRGVAIQIERGIADGYLCGETKLSPVETWNLSACSVGDKYGNLEERKSRIHYFSESEWCPGEFPGMQYEIFPSSRGDGFYEWLDKGEKLIGQGKEIAELGTIYGMDGEGILISIDSDSIEAMETEEEEEEEDKD